MNPFLRLFQEPRHKKLLLILIIIAFILRIWITFLTKNRIYDGEALSFLAYDWSLNPTFITSGKWTPGYRYLTGVFNWVIPNPFYATRIFNVIIGTLTIPVFYYVISALYNHAIAMISALVLVFLPIHIGMSASSLTSTSVLFEILVAILFVIKASNSNNKSSLYLSLSSLFIVLAESTRVDKSPF